MKKNPNQFLLLFLALIFFQLVIGYSLSPNFFTGMDLSSRIESPSDFWLAILTQLGVTIFIYVLEKRKEK